jgi:hypothetical protein
MGGAALATAGIAVGIGVITTGVVVPAPVGGQVAMIGLCLTGASAFLFVIFGVFYVLKSLKTPQ